MVRLHVSALRLLAAILLTVCPAFHICGKADDAAASDGECPAVAIKSNLLYDAAITPDIGVELSLSKHVSVALEGVYAWWSNDDRHRYWRIRGAWLDASWWFDNNPATPRLTGHHAGVYVSLHDYDFEFGGRGWQARNPAFGAGLAYGYAFRLNGRLSLDLHLKVGYSGGTVTEYVPQCGTYMCVRRFHNNYFGLTGVGVSIVWFPGRGSSNNPLR